SPDLRVVADGGEPIAGDGDGPRARSALVNSDEVTVIEDEIRPIEADPEKRDSAEISEKLAAGRRHVCSRAWAVIAHGRARRQSRSRRRHGTAAHAARRGETGLACRRRGARPAPGKGRARLRRGDRRLARAGGEA